MTAIKILIVIAIEIINLISLWKVLDSTIALKNSDVIPRFLLFIGLLEKCQTPRTSLLHLIAQLNLEWILLKNAPYGESQY